MRTLSHCAFGRFSTVREKVHCATSATCDWCGNRDRRNSLHRFGTQKDDSPSGTVNWAKGLFCSKSCANSYHN